MPGVAVVRAVPVVRAAELAPVAREPAQVVRAQVRAQARGPVWVLVLVPPVLVLPVQWAALEPQSAASVVW